MGEYLGLFNYWVYVLLMMLGLYAAVAKTNLVKKVIGLSLFQTGIFIFYISLGVVTVGDDSGAVPIFFGGHGHADTTPQVPLDDDAAGGEQAAGDAGPSLHADLRVGRPRIYSNPLPHVLILTAIVVSVSTLAVALAIIVSIKRAFGTIEADELAELELREDASL